LKTSNTFLAAVSGLALLFALLTGGYLLFKYVVSVFATLEPQVETLAAIASVVALLCAVIIAEGLKARGRPEQSILLAEKARIYERLLALCCDQLNAPSDQDDRSADAELVPLERALALYAGAKVISAYNEFRRSTKQAGIAADAATALLRKVVLEMGADLGRSDVIRSDTDLLDLLLAGKQKT